MELQLDLKKRYTYADYLLWADDKLRELLNGFIRLMSPAPTSTHQGLVIDIAGELRNIIKKHKGKCKVFPAPFDVRLPKNGEKDDNNIYTVVQPDVCVICDVSKIDERGCLGAPDLIVEIQSPSSAKYDLNIKYQIYEESGVREYWVVFPYQNSITKFLLQADGKFDDGLVYEDGKIPVTVFDGIEIELKEIFSE
jgi:Uma2 family endonuclease